MSMSSALQRPTKSPSLTTLAIDVGASAAAGGADGGSSIAPIALASTASSSSSSSTSSSAATPPAKSFDDDNEMIYCGVDLGQLTPTWQFIVLSGSVFFFYFAYSICQVRRARLNTCILLHILNSICSWLIVSFLISNWPGIYFQARRGLPLRSVPHLPPVHSVRGHLGPPTVRTTHKGTASVRIRIACFSSGFLALFCSFLVEFFTRFAAAERRCRTMR